MPFTGLGTNLGGFGAGDIIAYLGVGNTAQFESALKRSQAQTEAAAKKMQMALNVVAVAGAAVFVGAVKAAADFEKQMADVNTLLRDSSPFPQMKEDILDLAQEMPVSIKTLTSGLYDLVSAGVSAADSVDTLKLAAMAATAGVADVSLAVQAGMATVNAYGLSIGELNRIYDLQFSTIEKGVIRYEQLAHSIGTVLPAAKSLNVSLEDLYGSIAFLTKVGQSAEMATTNLSRAFQDMVAKKEGLAQLGVAIFDATGEFRGMEPVMRDLSVALDGMTTEQKQAELQTIGFDIRAGRAITSIIGNFEGFSQTLKDVADSSGSMTRAFEKQLETFSSQMTILKNILQSALIEIGNKYLPVIIDFVKKITADPEKLAQTIENIGRLVITLGGLAILAKTVIMVNNLRTAFAGLHLTASLLVGPAGILGLIAAGFIAIDAAAKKFDRKNIEEIGKTESLDLLQKNLEKLERQLEANKESMKFSGMAAAGFAKDNVKLANMIQATKDKIAELENATNDATGSMGDMDGSLDELTDTSDDYNDSIKKNIEVTDWMIRQYERKHDVEIRTVKPMKEVISAQEMLSKVVTEHLKKVEESIHINEEEIVTLDGVRMSLSQAYDHFVKTGEIVEDTGKKTEEAGRDWAAYLSLVRDIVNDLPMMKGASQTAKEGVNLLVGSLSQLLDGGIDPITLGLQVVGLALNAAFNKPEINRSIEQIANRLKLVGVSLGEIDEMLGLLPDKFQSDLINHYDQVLKASVEQMKTASGDVYDDLIERARFAADELKRITAAFMFGEEYQTIFTSLQSISEYAIEQIRLFGDNFIGKGGVVDLLKNNILSAFGELLKLDPGSVAFNQLYEQLGESFETIFALMGDDAGLAFLQEWFSMFASFESGEDQALLQQWFEGIVGLSKDAGEEAGEGFVRTFDQAFGMLGSFGDSETAEKIREMFREMAGMFSQPFGALGSFGDPDKIRALFESMAESARDGASDWRDYSQYMEGAASATEQMSNDTYDLNQELEEQIYLIQRLALEYENWLGYTFDQYDEYLNQLGRFDREGIFDPSGPLFTALQKLLDFGIDLEDTNVDEQISAWITQVELFLQTLDPDSAAYAALRAALDELIQKFAAMGGEIDYSIGGTKRLIEEGKKLGDLQLAGAGGTGGGFHSGGIVTAHSGFFAGDEVMAKLQKGEAVINRQVVSSFGENAFRELNRSGSLRGFGQRENKGETHVTVQIHKPGPNTYAEITEGVYPLIKEKQRDFEPGENPY